MAQGRTPVKEPELTPERAKLKELEALREKQAGLYHELDRSLALKSLWPEVFEHGKAGSQWLGRHQDPRALVLRVFNGADPREWRDFPGLEVPEVLWTYGDIRDSLTRYLERQKKNAAIQERRLTKKTA